MAFLLAKAGAPPQVDFLGVAIFGFTHIFSYVFLHSFLLKQVLLAKAGAPSCQPILPPVC
jgi:hypothetical protein